MLRSAAWAFVAALSSIAVTQPAAAWGARGHELIADLAYQRLTPAARAQVDKLLTYAPQQGTGACPVGNLHDAARWADCVRDKEPDLQKQMHLHHTDRIPVCGPVGPDSFCTKGRCAAGDIQREVSILSDARADPVQRLHALEAVIHLVGDEHQPLHAVSAAASVSNPVNFPGETKPKVLHGLWDSELVKDAVPKGGEAQLAAEADRNAASWSQGSFVDWALEANAVARKYAYPALPEPQSCGISAPGVTQNISPAYIQQAIPAVRMQLERAGVRLALVLNRALR